MFNKIIKMFNERKRQNQIKEQQENKRKYYEIRGAVIKFYEHKDATEGTVNIPAFQRADAILKEVIKTPQDINYYYGRLVKYGAVA